MLKENEIIHSPPSDLLAQLVLCILQKWGPSFKSWMVSHFFFFLIMLYGVEHKTLNHFLLNHHYFFTYLSCFSKYIIRYCVWFWVWNSNKKSDEIMLWSIVRFTKCAPLCCCPCQLHGSWQNNLKTLVLHAKASQMTKPRIWVIISKYIDLLEI